MTIRQALLKLGYPFLMLMAKLKKGEAKLNSNQEVKKPIASFYDLRYTLNNGFEFSFEALKGKKVLLVNTASNCGFTNQYKDLEKLQQQFKTQLVILGFPSNDFKQQEKGTDEEIDQFCKQNFDIHFSLMKKSSVSKGPDQNEVYQWLSKADANGWNNQPPAWNFSKYLVDEEGTLTHFFGPGISPISSEVLNAITL